MTTSLLELHVSGMTCGSCERHVHDALAAAPGVLSVDSVRFGDSSARVSVRADADTDAVAQAATDAGYPARLVQLRPAPSRGPRPNRDFDLVIVGSGSAAFAAIIAAREEGRSVALVEGGTLGGTCVNVGCVPSKFFIQAAAQQHRAQDGFYQGLNTSAAPPDAGRLVAQKRALVDSLRAAKYESVLENHAPVELVRGWGRLEAGDGGVDVVVGERRLRADKVLVATGSRAWTPDVEGLEDVGLWTSTEALDAGEIPESVVVMGGGVVGLELAQMLSRLGARVTVLMSRDRLLPAEDEEISREIERLLTAEGLVILTSARALRARHAGGGLEVDALVDGVERTIPCQRVLNATGRRANTADLGLTDLGVSLDPRGAVIVDPQGRTGHPDVFAAGDVAVGPMFVYVAAHQGKVAAQAAFGGEATVDLSTMPRVTFTAPQVASVGLTEAQARDAGHAVMVSRLPLSFVPRAIVNGQTEGLIKLIADSKTDLLLGAHVVAPEAAELVHQAAQMIRAGTPVSETAAALHAYLTWAEGLKLACQTFRKSVETLSCCAA